MTDEEQSAPGGEEQHDARRVHRRDSMFLNALLRPGDITIKIRNLSAGGLMADCEDALSKGSQVEVELPGVGVVRGKIAWRTAQRIGIEFERAIDPQRARRPVGTKAPTLVPAPQPSTWRPGFRTKS